MIGQNLAHYRVLEKLGAGGMGEVYRAQDEKLGRDVAIKVLPAGTLGDSTARIRLMREARAAAALNHPHICIVHDVGESDSRAYIAMELVSGQALSDRLLRGPIAPETVVRYGVQLADALAHAHQRGILHRDLKCANVLITSEDRPKILDFGLAKRFSDDVLSGMSTASASITEEGTIVGTFPYLAPEQLNGQSADARSDIWALGVMLYEMACGVRPFRGRTRYELTAAIMTALPPALPATVPRDLQAVILRCLEKDPSRRYQQAAEVRAALEAVQSGRFVATQGSRPVGRTIAGAVLAALILAAIAFVGRDILQSKPPTPAVSIAVLPFSGAADPEERFLVDGMQDALIGELSHIKSMRVISRFSAEKFRDTKKTLPEIAKALNVGHVVEGSVQRAGNRVAAKLRLVSTEAEERAVWSQTFDRNDDELISLQRDAARDIAFALGVDLSPAEREHFSSARRVDREAYELYLRGMHSLNTFTQDGYKKGLGYLHQAVDRDPTDAKVYAALAVGYALVGHGSGAGSGPEAFAKARAAAEQALKIDDTIAEAHGALAEANAYLSWDFDAAAREYKRALQLNPNADEIRRHYAWLHLLFWRYDDAVRELKAAQQINPLRPVHYAELGWLHLYTGDYDAAIEHATKALELNPAAGNAKMVIGTAHSLKGNHDQAIAVHQKLMSERPLAKPPLVMTYVRAGRRDEAKKLLDTFLGEQGMDRAWQIARVYATLGDHDEAFRWAEISYKRRDWGFPWIFHEKVYENIRKDPRYRAMMARINVPVS